MTAAGTHIPVLTHAVKLTTGPVLELGMGLCSFYLYQQAKVDYFTIDIRDLGAHNSFMSVAGIRVLTIGKPFAVPYDVKHLDETSHLQEVLATFRPDVIVSAGFVPGPLTQAPHELRKRWIHLSEPTVEIPDLCQRIENCYVFNLWTEHQYQKDHPIVSVYTPTYNTGDYITETYQSLKEQTYANWEWVVVDDRSTDKTWERLKEYAQQDYRVRPFQSAVHHGKIGTTKDLATKLCRGKYLVELDHDDMLTETALLDVKNAFEEHPEVGMVYTNSASFFENGAGQRFGNEPPWNSPDRYREVVYHGKKYLECKNPNIYDRFGPHFTQVFGWYLTVGPHHIRSYRAKTFRKLGGYNPELPVADDWDLYARFFLESECFHLDKLLYLYRYRDGFANATFQRIQSIQDHLAVGRNHYAEAFSRKNAELMKKAEKAKTKAPPTAAGISFVVLDATGGDDAVKCLTSIKKYSPESEIILVENGCSSKAKSLANIVVESSANLGFGAGCNYGAQSATREFLCFLNDDAELVDKATVRNLLDVAKGNVIAGVYSDKAKPPQGNYTKKTSPRNSLPAPMVVGLCMMLPRALFENLGGFDTRFLTWEDDDLCKRARLLGAPSMVVSQTFVHHKGHQTFEALKLDHLEVEKANQALFAQKHQKIKVICIAKNEENCIVDFFKQFEGITKDWFMLDTGSTDRTIELAKAIGVQVFSEPFVDFATTRNRALELFDNNSHFSRGSLGNWIIMLDPDERLDPQTIEAIPELVFNQRSPSAGFETYLAPLIAVNPDGSRKEFVAKPFLFLNDINSKWQFKVHEKWISSGQYALVTNSCLEHRIALHTGKHREGAEGLYAKLMSEEPYFQNPEFKRSVREACPILDYDRPYDPRIEKIQAGPLVSVVVPTYKRLEMLRKAVESALKQSYKTLEVVVIGDHCPDLDQEDARTGVLADPRVRVSNLPQNHGAGGAVPRNVGINLAQGPYIAYLDDDNTWAPDHVGNLLTTILRERTIWGWSSMMVNGVDMKFDKLERGKIDTSCVIHHKSLIFKHGPWRNRTQANYWHDFELFSRWREEPQTVTKYPSVNYNASSSGQADFLARVTSTSRVIDIAFDPNSEIPREPNLLTIGILGLESRTALRHKLVAELGRQRAELPNADSVRIIVNIDDGTMPTGAKRQSIVNALEDAYLCFVDDDDWIEPGYIQTLLRALKAKPDCVTFKGVITTDGRNPEIFRLSLHYPVRIWSRDPQGVHMRTPNHLCPIKRELVSKVPYKSVHSYEDALWSMNIYPHLRTQCHIDAVLYQYRYSPAGSEAAKKEPKLIPGKYFDLRQDGKVYDAVEKSYSPEAALEVLTDLFGTAGPQAAEFRAHYPQLFRNT